MIWVGARRKGHWPAAVSKAAYLVAPDRLTDLPVAFTVAGCVGHALQPGVGLSLEAA
jgi:hypothetical protein